MNHNGDEMNQEPVRHVARISLHSGRETRRESRDTYAEALSRPVSLGARNGWVTGLAPTHCRIARPDPDPPTPDPDPPTPKTTLERPSW